MHGVRQVQYREQSHLRSRFHSDKLILYQIMLSTAIPVRPKALERLLVHLLRKSLYAVAMLYLVVVFEVFYSRYGKGYRAGDK